MKLELNDLPSIGWMNKLNEKRYFSGSVGTSGTKGNFSVHTFAYRIWKKEAENEDGSKNKYFCVSCYIVPPQNSTEAASENEEQSFAASEESLPEILNWLNERIARYDCIGR